MAQSLKNIHLQVFLILLLCFVAIGYAGFLALRDMQLASNHERVSQVADDTSKRINGLVAQQREALEKIAQQPGVAVVLLQRGAALERARKQEEIKSLLTGAVSVNLLPRNSLGAFSATEGPIRPVSTTSGAWPARMRRRLRNFIQSTRPPGSTTWRCRSGTRRRRPGCRR